MMLVNLVLMVAMGINFIKKYQLYIIFCQILAMMALLVLLVHEYVTDKRYFLL